MEGSEIQVGLEAEGQHAAYENITAGQSSVNLRISPLATDTDALNHPIHHQPDLAVESLTCALVSVLDMVLNINWSYPKLAESIKHSPSHTLAWRTLHSWAKTLLPFRCNTMQCKLTYWSLKTLATGGRPRSIGRDLVHVRHFQHGDGIHEFS